MSLKKKAGTAVAGLGITVAGTGVVAILSGAAILGPIGLIALGSWIFVVGHEIRK